MMRKFMIFSLTLLLMTCRGTWSAPIVLNEYNAVTSSNQLDGGTGADSFFGKIEGNGGNWFELLVIDDHLDMRQWRLDWTEEETVGGTNENAAGTITLANHALWSDLRSGSIITFIETRNAEGKGNFNTSTDASYNPLANDWWINVSTQEEQPKVDGLTKTTTNDGSPGDFSVGNDNWNLTVRNASGAAVFGPVGEGAGWAGGNVGNEEAAKLEGPIGTPQDPLTLDDWRAVAPTSEFYDDTGNTSFGAPNMDYDVVNGTFLPLQDVSLLRAQVGPGFKSGDFNNDGQLTAADINTLTLAVRSGSTEERFDVNNDRSINGDDRKTWVENIRKSYFGDSNLDGEFSSADFVFIFQAGQYEDNIPGNSLWESGDWDGDGDFSTTDFVLAFQAAGYESGPRPAAAVPEPTAAGLLLALSGMVFLVRRPAQWRT